MENITDTDLQKLISEAEERGYNRGLNEKIEKQMATPGVWEQPESPPEPETYQILSNRPRSIWD